MPSYLIYIYNSSFLFFLKVKNRHLAKFAQKRHFFMPPEYTQPDFCKLLFTYVNFLLQWLCHIPPFSCIQGDFRVYSKYCSNAFWAPLMPPLINNLSTIASWHDFCPPDLSTIYQQSINTSYTTPLWTIKNFYAPNSNTCPKICYILDSRSHARFFP